MRHISKFIASATIALSAVIVTSVEAADKTRRCDGGYRWATTGGTYDGSFGAITAFGKKSTARNARKAARAALMDCVQAHWDERWDRKVPNRCKIGARVERYDLGTICKKRKDNQNPDKVCDDSGHSSNSKVVVNVGDGDLKTALEVQVCCKLGDGTVDFPNENSVFVRLSGHSWSTNPNTGQQKECNGKRELFNNYEINCARVRDNVCNRR